MLTCLVCGTSGIPDGSKNCPSCGNSMAGPEVLGLPIGTLLIGRYRIVKVLGRGGFGITYKGIHTLLKQPVAIKEYFPEGAVRQGMQVVITASSAAQQEFLLEGQHLVKLNHPNIVRVLDVFEANQTAYLVMDFVEGESLAEIIQQRGKVSEAEAMNYVIQMAEALKAVH